MNDIPLMARLNFRLSICLMLNSHHLLQVGCKFNFEFD